VITAQVKCHRSAHLRRAAGCARSPSAAVSSRASRSRAGTSSSSAASPSAAGEAPENYALAPVCFGNHSETHCLTTDHKSAFQLWRKAAFLTGKGISQLAVAGGSAGKRGGTLCCSRLRLPGRRNAVINGKMIPNVVLDTQQRGRLPPAARAAQPRQEGKGWTPLPSTSPARH